MRHARLSTIGILALFALVLASCAPAAPSPTAPPAKPTEAPKPAAKPTEAPKPAAKPTEVPAAKPAASPAAKPTEAKPAAKPSGPPVKVGFIAPLSGAVAAYGAALKHIPTMVLKEVNASGGINGSPLEVVAYDSPNNPNQTVTGMRRLANEDKVVAIIGPYYTGEMQVAVPLLKDLKVPTLAYTPSASHPGSVEPNQWAFLANSNEELSATHALNGFKKLYPNVKKMVVAGDNQTSVTAISLKEVWPKILPANGYEIVDTITFQFATTDFSAIATRIKASGAEGMAISALSPAAPNLFKELERQGVKLPIVSGSYLHTIPPLPKLAGSTVDGLVQTMWFSPELRERPRVRQWLDSYLETARAEGATIDRNDVGFGQEPAVYDHFHMLVKAMREAGIKGDTPVDQAREKTRAALMNIKGFEGVLGTTKEINAQGRITWEFYPLVARGGEYQPIK